MLILGLIGLKVTVHVQSQSHHPTDVCQNYMYQQILLRAFNPITLRVNS